ncbi:peptidyl-tRNA hydrolase [Coccomyxa subellipsoidea C-169]|uniref:peptidyl-tRNA hydrolase n=1 Tax=Coccomyxa subellipsoidea (strain C-169) TaxID=574566 RepID=I0YN92_COCSC|nr:peptidyl-tRNA hydrolase [Coccomyxa subellipsoidea C-169]EIE19861.1 peptidyl-tRNA hydrolase [Coccomyxa subellipsoidea C-169]|eukprot:XP_005644405.1 peptidyl-tRNA hydrolase [Coccomyxa subellipsoidea C-169]
MEAEGEDLWLVVGLGNPGKQYADTRHNVGFMLVDELARQLGASLDKLQHSAALGRGRFCGKRVLLAKPMTFMNNSGESANLKRLFPLAQVPLERVLVVYDDLDLDSGAVRLRAKGGHGGHNGMRSITQHFSGSKDFPRLRIGIGRPPGSQQVVSYVLQGFGRKERDEIYVAIQEGIDIVRAVLTLGMEKAVSGNRVPR